MLRQVIDSSLGAIAAKDLDRALAGFADRDAVLIDPHYPVPRMVGRDAIAGGLTWAFATMRQLDFVVDRYFFADDGTGAAVEVTSDHVLKNGRPIHLKQAFVVETRDGLIVRWQAYEPYGPHGIAGIARRLSAARQRYGRRPRRRG
jgi:ketosteroid isomerase-like protein